MSDTERKRILTELATKHGVLKARERIPVAKVTPLTVQLISNDRVLFDYNKAQEYIDLPFFKAERYVRPDHVRDLAEHMKRGTFNWNNVMLVSAWFKGVRYKINGQNTSWAIFEAKVDTESVNEHIYKVEDEDQIRKLYATYDSHLPRTQSHLNQIYLVNTPAAEGLNLNVIKSISSAVKFWRIPDREAQRAVKADELCALISNNYPTIFQVVGNYYHDHKSAKIMGSQPVTATLFETFSVSVEKATLFWDSVCDGVSFDCPNDPRYRLREFLLEVAINTTGLKAKKVVSAEAVYRVVIYCWNKWRDGEKISQLRIPQHRPKAH